MRPRVDGIFTMLFDEVVDVFNAATKDERREGREEK